MSKGKKVPLSVGVKEEVAEAVREVAAGSRPPVNASQLVGWILEEWVRKHHPGLLPEEKTEVGA